ncbi:MAG: PIN domain-containing protein, partial [Pseudomonadota bacterium]
MIAFDTNVLCRVFVDDNQPQHDRARRALADCADRGEQVFVSAIVLVECLWMLRGKFRWTPDELHWFCQHIHDT